MISHVLKCRLSQVASVVVGVICDMLRQHELSSPIVNVH
jgi:hypothetical protein